MSGCKHICPYFLEQSYPLFYPQGIWWTQKNDEKAYVLPFVC